MLRIEAVDENHAVGRASSAVICIWRHDTTVEAIGGLGSVASQFRRGNQGALLSVVELGATTPESDARAELARIFSTLAGSIACSALVFEGTGFRAAAVRAIATTIAQVSQAPFPHRVFSSVELAADWLASHELPLSPPQLVSDVADVRSAIDAHERSAG